MSVKYVAYTSVIALITVIAYESYKARSSSPRLRAAA